jgi:hypothetical protein
MSLLDEARQAARHRPSDGVESVTREHAEVIMAILNREITGTAGLRVLKPNAQEKQTSYLWTIAFACVRAGLLTVSLTAKKEENK